MLQRRACSRSFRSCAPSWAPGPGEGGAAAAAGSLHRPSRCWQPCTRYLSTSLQGLQVAVAGLIGGQTGW
jgi:hypothetical protein